MGEKKTVTGYDIEEFKTENIQLNERIDTLYKHIVTMNANSQRAIKRIAKLEKPVVAPKCACDILGVESCVIHSEKD